MQRRPARVYERWPQVRDSVDLVTGKRLPRDEAERAKLRYGDAKLEGACLYGWHGHNEPGTPYWQSLGINRRMRHRRRNGTFTPYDRCIRGHLFTEDNTGHNPKGRFCVICNRDLQRVRNAQARRRRHVERELRMLRDQEAA